MSEAESAKCRTWLATAPEPSALQWRQALELKGPLCDDAPAFLAQAVLTNADPNVGRWAAGVLGQSSNPEARELLLDALDRVQDGSVLQGVIEALPLACTRQDVPRILRALRKRQAEPLWHMEVAPDALACLGDAAAVEYLHMVLQMPIQHPGQRDSVYAAALRAIEQLHARAEFEARLTEMRSLRPDEEPT
jgi:hypothetical protein